MAARVILYFSIIGILIVSALFAFSFVKAEERVSPGTKIGSVDLSNLTYEQALSSLEKIENKDINLSLPFKSYALNYQDLGVTFDNLVIRRHLQKCYFRDYCFKEIQASEEGVKGLVMFDENKFKEIVREIDESLAPMSDSPQVSFGEGLFYAQDPEAKVVVDVNHLVSQLTAENIFQDQGLTIQLRTVTYIDKESQQRLTEELAKKLSTDSLLIKYGRQPVTLPAERIAQFVETVTREDKTVGLISPEKVKEYLLEVASKYSKLKVEIEEKAAIRAVQYALLFRISGEQVNRPVILPLKGGPSTDGSLAKKYLEVDKSKQKMYRFEDGKVTKTYTISTGLTWETPSGDFKIQRKQGLSISYFGNWYMPYYMPIGKIHGTYNFGFHEIPYQLGANGQIKSRDPMSMGSPATGGCIQLDFGDAKEIYDWAEINMPVVIHD